MDTQPNFFQPAYQLFNKVEDTDELKGTDVILIKPDRKFNTIEDNDSVRIEFQSNTEHNFSTNMPNRKKSYCAIEDYDKSYSNIRWSHDLLDNIDANPQYEDDYGDGQHAYSENEQGDKTPIKTSWSEHSNIKEGVGDLWNFDKPQPEMESNRENNQRSVTAYIENGTNSKTELNCNRKSSTIDMFLDFFKDKPKPEVRPRDIAIHNTEEGKTVDVCGHTEEIFENTVAHQTFVESENKDTQTPYISNKNANLKSHDILHSDGRSTRQTEMPESTRVWVSTDSDLTHSKHRIQYHGTSENEFSEFEEISEVLKNIAGQKSEPTDTEFSEFEDISDELIANANNQEFNSIENHDSVQIEFLSRSEIGCSPTLALVDSEPEITSTTNKDIQIAKRPDNLVLRTNVRSNKNVITKPIPEMKIMNDDWNSATMNHFREFFTLKQSCTTATGDVNKDGGFNETVTTGNTNSKLSKINDQTGGLIVTNYASKKDSQWTQEPNLSDATDGADVDSMRRLKRNTNPLKEQHWQKDNQVSRRNIMDIFKSKSQTNDKVCSPANGSDNEASEFEDIPDEFMNIAPKTFVDRQGIRIRKQSVTDSSVARSELPHGEHNEPNFSGNVSSSTRNGVCLQNQTSSVLALKPNLHTKMGVNPSFNKVKAESIIIPTKNKQEESPKSQFDSIGNEKQWVADPILIKSFLQSDTDSSRDISITQETSFLKCIGKRNHDVCSNESKTSGADDSQVDGGLTATVNRLFDFFTKKPKLKTNEHIEKNDKTIEYKVIPQQLVKKTEAVPLNLSGNSSMENDLTELNDAICYKGENGEVTRIPDDFENIPSKINQKNGNSCIEINDTAYSHNVMGYLDWTRHSDIPDSTPKVDISICEQHANQTAMKSKEQQNNNPSTIEKVLDFCINKLKVRNAPNITTCGEVNKVFEFDDLSTSSSTVYTGDHCLERKQKSSIHNTSRPTGNDITPSYCQTAYGEMPATPVLPRKNNPGKNKCVKITKTNLREEHDGKPTHAPAIDSSSSENGWVGDRVVADACPSSEQVRRHAKSRRSFTDFLRLNKSRMKGSNPGYTACDKNCRIIRSSGSSSSQLGKSKSLRLHVGKTKKRNDEIRASVFFLEDFKKNKTSKDQKSSKCDGNQMAQYLRSSKNSIRKNREGRNQTDHTSFTSSLSSGTPSKYSSSEDEGQTNSNSSSEPSWFKCKACELEVFSCEPCLRELMKCDDSNVDTPDGIESDNKVKRGKKEKKSKKQWKKQNDIFACCFPCFYI